MVGWNALLLVGLLGGVKYFIEYRDWIGLSKTVILRTAPGPCKVVIEDGGAEDVLNIGDNIVLLTQGVNLHHIPGSITAFDLGSNTQLAVNLTNVPSRTDFLAAPHGMTSWRDPDTDQQFIYVLTHPASGDRIEVFELVQPLTLKLVRSITDPGFNLMNDLVAVGRDQFYITRFWQCTYSMACGVAEGFSGLQTGGVMYYDGRKAREVATSSMFSMANGINVSPDGSMVYVADFGNGLLHGFNRQSTNNLEKAWVFDADTGVDNIEVDPDTGDLWIGCHPHLYKILDFYSWFGYTNPSQVIRVKLRDQRVSSVEQIYSDDGHEIVGSTVAAYINNKLIVGSVSAQTIVCDVRYLSP